MSLVGLMCARIRLWSDHSHPEVTSDHAISRPKWPQIISSPDRSDLWSDRARRKSPLIIPSPDLSELWSNYCALEPNPRPCTFGLGTHRVRWTCSDQRSLPDGTSTWVRLEMGPVSINSIRAILLLKTFIIDRKLWNKFCTKSKKNSVLGFFSITSSWASSLDPKTHQI